MVAVNLLASLLTTNNLCTSICLSIIACMTMANFNITLVVFCRLSDMRRHLRGGGHVSLFLCNKLACSSVTSNFVF